MTGRLGKVTATNPVRVELNGDTTAEPAEPYQGQAVTVGQEVLVQTVEGRRLIVWAKL